MHFEGEFTFYSMLEGFVQSYEHKCRMINLLILTFVFLYFLSHRTHLDTRPSFFCDIVLTEELYVLVSESGS
jgi:hypothetical protein